MINPLNRLIVRVSGSGWLFLLNAVLMMGSLLTLLRIAEGFPAVAGGAQPFDMQMVLTAREVMEQLAFYAADARRQYAFFAAVDFVFPFAAGLFLAALGAFCLRRSYPSLYGTLNNGSFLPLFMLGSLFDWGENLAAIGAIWLWPDTPEALATALVIAKRCKLALVTATQLTVLVLLALTAVREIQRRRQNRITGGTFASDQTSKGTSLLEKGSEKS